MKINLIFAGLIFLIFLSGCAKENPLVPLSMPERGFFLGVLPMPAINQSFDSAYYKASLYSDFVPVWGKPTPFYELSNDLIGSWGKLFIDELIISNGMFPLIHFSFIDLGITLKSPNNMINASLSDPEWRQLYKQSVISAVKAVNPHYVSVGNEVNRWHEKYGYEGSNGFKHFVSLYEEVYDEIKKISPKTKVFCTFAMEIVSENKEADLNVLSYFNKSKLDLLVLTSYPHSLGIMNPSLIPDDYYLKAHNYFPEKNMGFSEIAWPSMKEFGGEQTQADFIVQATTRLTKEQGINLELFAWPWLTDLNENDSTGLIMNNGSEKLAWQAWKNLSRI